MFKKIMNWLILLLMKLVQEEPDTSHEYTDYSFNHLYQLFVHKNTNNIMQRLDVRENAINVIDDWLDELPLDLDFELVCRHYPDEDYQFILHFTLKAPDNLPNLFPPVHCEIKLPRLDAETHYTKDIVVNWINDVINFSFREEFQLADDFNKKNEVNK